MNWLLTIIYSLLVGFGITLLIYLLFCFIDWEFIKVTLKEIRVLIILGIMFSLFIFSLLLHVRH